MLTRISVYLVWIVVFVFHLVIVQYTTELHTDHWSLLTHIHKCVADVQRSIRDTLVVNLKRYGTYLNFGATTEDVLWTDGSAVE